MPVTSAIRPTMLIFVPLALLACGGGAATSSGGEPTTPTPVLTGGDAAKGEKLYAEMGCKGCHGAAGEKDEVGPNLFAVKWDDHEREEARQTILEGDLDHKPPMPSFKGKLDDAQIADILAYVSKK